MMTKLLAFASALVALGSSAADDVRPSSFAYWKMDELVDGKVPDETGNGHDLELGAGCSLTRTSLFGSGLAFDGNTTNAWARFSYPELTDRTVSMWFRRGADDGSLEGNTYTHLFGQFGKMRALFNHVDPGAALQNALTVYCGEASVYSGTSCAMKREEWTHVVITYSESGEEGSLSGTVRVYRNGVKVKEIDQTGIVTAKAVAATGGVLGNQGVNQNRPINGVLDEVKVADSAWSDADILNEYLAGAKGGDPLAYRWTADAIDNGVVHPAVGGIDLTLGAGISLTNGVSGKALWYDGTRDAYARFALPESLYSFTAMAWVYQSQLQALQVVPGNGAPRFFACNTGYSTLNSGVRGLVCSYVTQGAASAVVSANPAQRTGKESWSHIAISEDVFRDGDALSCTVRIFVNGRLIDEKVVPFADNTLLAAKPFTFGSNGTDRPLHGMMDDLRIYRKALSADEVAAAYRGVADFSAGEDFTVAGESTVLCGRLDLTGRQPVQLNAAAKVEWSLVSAPVGGEDAKILAPSNPQTGVVLPVTGTYVFRMTVSGDVVETDEVAVTRAAATGTAPTVSVAAAAPTVSSPAPAVLTATVSDPSARVSWSKVSGPGGVYFEPPYAAATKALFTAPGTYVLACRAENAAGSASGSVEVSVTGTAGAVLSDEHLIHYWDFDAIYFGDSNEMHPRTIDRVTGTQLTYNNQASISNLTARSQSGYGFSVINYDDYLSLTSGDGGTSAATYSFWQYIDGSKVTSSSRILRSGNIEIWVLNSQNTSSKDVYFRAYLNDATGKWYYWDSDCVGSQLAKGSPRNRWSHLTVTFDKSSSSDKAEIDGKVRIYVDGTAIKMTPQARVDGFSFAAKDCGTLYLGYTTAERFFPGIIDELRVYDTLLTQPEVARLSVDVAPVNRAPVVELKSSVVKTVAKAQSVFDVASVFDDGLPEDGALSAAWELVSGAADRVTFSTVANNGLSVRGKKGTYVFRLRANDGERESVSDPLTVEIEPAGCVIICR